MERDGRFALPHTRVANWRLTTWLNAHMGWLADLDTAFGSSQPPVFPLDHSHSSGNPGFAPGTLRSKRSTLLNTPIPIESGASIICV
jgi:hypothetical protein